MKKAFTLAEVLITLGIIGIIAALTIPGLIADYQKKATSTKLKKFYSMMHQATMLSEIDNGDMSGWDYTYNGDGAATEKFFMQYLAPYMKYLSITNESDLPDTSMATRTVVLADGSWFTIHSGSCFTVVYRTNPKNKAVVAGKSSFAFVMCPQESSLCAFGKLFCPYGMGTDYDAAADKRAFALETCKTSTDKCALLLQLDNWEFAPDYPW